MEHLSSQVSLVQGVTHVVIPFTKFSINNLTCTKEAACGTKPQDNTSIIIKAMRTSNLKKQHYQNAFIMHYWMSY
jgi:hypothetical protein